LGYEKPNSQKHLGRTIWALWSVRNPFRLSAQKDSCSGSAVEKRRASFAVTAMECAARGLTAEPCAVGSAHRRCGSCGAVAYCSRAHQVSLNLLGSLPEVQYL
jgi:hypothetical protein